MGENTKIEWTATVLPDGTKLPGHTFNPWIGCEKISPACMNCYAAEMDHRFNGGVNWGKNAPRRITSDSNWHQPLKWNKFAAKNDVRFNVFCGSLCDVGEDREDLLAPRYRLMELIHITPHLNWLLLTKRPENYLRLFGGWGDKWPLNVWAGTTVESQKLAHQRIPHLLAVPAQVHFLSCEPLLGPLQLDEYWRDGAALSDYWETWLDGIDWVIAGGESGPAARPSNPDWFRVLRDQCVAHEVPYFFKQWGEWCDFDTTLNLARLSPDCISPDKFKRISPNGEVEDVANPPRRNHMIVYRAGKKAAGRLLDGRTWDQMPRTER